MLGDVLFLWSVVCFLYGLHRNIGRKCVCIYIYVRLRALRGLLHKQLFSIISCRTTDVIMVRPWMLWKSYALVPRALSWFGHGCFGNRMHLYHGRHYGLAMDALI